MSSSSSSADDHPRTVRSTMSATTMKRKRSSSSSGLQLEIPNSNTAMMINSIPQDVVTEILSKVASSSLVDLLNANQTCKFFREAGEDKLVFQRVSMDALPVVQWHSSDKISSFLKRCQEAQNPEALYRLGMVEFFKNMQIEAGRKLLQKASNLGHTVATYVLGLILLDSGDEQSIDKGRELLNKILTKKYKRSRNQEVEECREKSKIIFRQLWINNFLHRPNKTKCNNPKCTKKTHKKRNGWLPNDGDDDCETCKCNRELTLFCNMLGVY